MMESVKNTLDGAKNGWNKIDTKKRISMIILVAGIILIVSILTYNNNKVDYVTLFSNLELQDAGIIVNDLETKKIKYKLESNGRNILIDDNIVDEYRLQLAMDGMMPESSTGFEIFDNTGLMVTDEDRQIMYQRALTGELQRSIMSLEAINSAKVHLVMPVKSIFETVQKDASASVIIDIHPSHKVTEDMIRGIASLLSGAVDKMPIENIQVIDSKGNLLSNFLNEDKDLNAMDVMNQYQAIRSQFQSEIESNIINLLGSAFGKEKIKVSVLADLDFDSKESTIIAYSNPVTRSEQISATGENVDIQRVTGGSIDDNISNVTDNNDGGGSTYSRTLNNELSTETITSIKAPGKVNRITTSVIYNGKLSDENLLKIQSIVASAIGYDIERGDLISVEGIEFDTEYEKQIQAELDAIRLEEEAGKGMFGKYSEYITLALRALGIITVITLIILSVRNMKKRKKEDELFQEQLSAGTIINQTLGAIDDELIIEEDSKGQKAQKFAKESPELAADLIKAWMKD